MNDFHPPEHPPVGRRTFLSRTIKAIHSALGATLTFLIGGAIVGPSFETRDAAWLRAGTLGDLPDGEPHTVTVRAARTDGYTQSVERVVVYLVKRGDRVRALHSTCTHLGCRTSYDRDAKKILCPCHGGVYDGDGRVIAGPPPAALPELETRIEGGEVLVRL